METKVCSKCHIEKDISEFSMRKNRKSKYVSQCKKCQCENGKQYRKNNEEKVKKSRKIYYDKNAEKLAAHTREYYKNHAEEERRKKREHIKNNREIMCERSKKYYNENKEKVIEYRKNNKENRRDQNNKRHKERVKIDPIYKLKKSMRRRICAFLKQKGYKKTSNSFEMVGCSPNDLKKYIEAQFTERMSWENHGFYGWHIDHKIPLASGKTKEEVIKLFHYTNLQPLWWIDNLNKKDKIL
jgi:hypothetical protein